jgi:hypothetical protein
VYNVCSIDALCFDWENTEKKKKSVKLFSKFSETKTAVLKIMNVTYTQFCHHFFKH